jgi:hypothetical protein
VHIFFFSLTVVCIPFAAEMPKKPVVLSASDIRKLPSLLVSHGLDLPRRLDGATALELAALLDLNSVLFVDGYCALYAALRSYAAAAVCCLYEVVHQSLFDILAGWLRELRTCGFNVVVLLDGARPAGKEANGRTGAPTAQQRASLDRYLVRRVNCELSALSADAVTNLPGFHRFVAGRKASRAHSSPRCLGAEQLMNGMREALGSDVAVVQLEGDVDRYIIELVRAGLNVNIVSNDMYDMTLLAGATCIVPRQTSVVASGCQLSPLLFDVFSPQQCMQAVVDFCKAHKLLPSLSVVALSDDHRRRVFACYCGACANDWTKADRSIGLHDPLPASVRESVGCVAHLNKVNDQNVLAELVDDLVSADESHDKSVAWARAVAFADNASRKAFAIVDQSNSRWRKPAAAAAAWTKDKAAAEIAPTKVARSCCVCCLDFWCVFVGNAFQVGAHVFGFARLQARSFVEARVASFEFRRHDALLALDVRVPGTERWDRTSTRVVDRATLKLRFARYRPRERAYVAWHTKGIVQVRGDGEKNVLSAMAFSFGLRGELRRFLDRACNAKQKLSREVRPCVVVLSVLCVCLCYVCMYVCV